MNKIYQNMNINLGRSSDNSVLTPSWLFSQPLNTAEAVQGAVNAALAIAFDGSNVIIPADYYNQLVNTYAKASRIAGIVIPQKLWLNSGELILDTYNGVNCSLQFKDRVLFDVCPLFAGQDVNIQPFHSGLHRQFTFDEFKGTLSKFDEDVSNGLFARVYYLREYKTDGTTRDFMHMYTYAKPSSQEWDTMYKVYQYFSQTGQRIDQATIDMLAQSWGHEAKFLAMAYNTVMMRVFLTEIEAQSPEDVHYTHYNSAQGGSFFSNNYEMMTTRMQHIDDTYASKRYIYRIVKGTEELSIDINQVFAEIYASSNSVFQHYFNNVHDLINAKMGTKDILYVGSLVTGLTDSVFYDQTNIKFKPFAQGHENDIQFSALLTQRFPAPTNAGDSASSASVLDAQYALSSSRSLTSGVLTFVPAIDTSIVKTLKSEYQREIPQVLPTDNTLNLLSNDGELSAWDASVGKMKPEFKTMIEEESKELYEWRTIAHINSDSLKEVDINNLKTIEHNFAGKLGQQYGLYLDSAWNNAAHAVNGYISDIELSSDTVLEMSSVTESALVNLNQQIVNLSKPDVANQAANQAQDTILQFSSALEDLSNDYGFELSSEFITEFSDPFIQAQMKINTFKLEYAKWVVRQATVIKKFSDSYEDHLTRRNKRFRSYIPSLDQETIVKIGVVNQSLDKVIPKLDVNLPEINIAWIGKLMLSFLSGMISKAVQTISIIDNIFSVLEKHHLNYTINKKFRPCYVEGSPDTKYAIVGIPTTSAFTRVQQLDGKFFLNSKGGRSFKVANLTTAIDQLYYIVKIEDPISLEAILNSYKNDASKMFSAITGQDLDLCYLPHANEILAATGVVAAQASLAAASAAVTASGWLGKGIAAAVAAATVFALNAVSAITWMIKRNGKTPITKYVRNDPYRNYDTLPTSDVLIINDFNNLLAVRGSNAKFVLSIVTDVVAMGAGLIGAVAIGAVTGALQSAITKFRTKRKIVKQMKKNETMLVGGVPFKTKDLNSTQKRSIAGGALQTDASPNVISSMIGGKEDPDQHNAIIKYVNDIRDGMRDLKTTLADDVVESITNSNNMLVESLKSMTSIASDVALQALLLNRINRKLGF